MKKLVSLVVVTSMMFLTACGKKTDNYVGYWQNKGGAISQIKKDGSNYILVDKIVANGMNGTPLETLPLTEKDGKLTANIGLGDMPLALSEDNKTLYIAQQSYSKIDEAKKNETIEKAKEAQKKAVELNGKCQALSKEYAEKMNAIPITFDGSAKGKQDSLTQEYVAKFNQIETDSKCQIKPLGIKSAQEGK